MVEHLHEQRGVFYQVQDCHFYVTKRFITALLFNFIYFLVVDAEVIVTLLLTICQGES